MTGCAVSEEDLILLARKWRETLPPGRGVLKYLRDFMQLKLELGPSGRPSKKLKRHRKRKSKQPLL